MLAHELGAGILVAVRTPLDQPGLTPVDVRPCDGSKRLHRETLCHLIPAPTRSVGSFSRLEPAPGARFPRAVYFWTLRRGRTPRPASADRVTWTASLDETHTGRPAAARRPRDARLRLRPDPPRAPVPPERRPRRARDGSG